MLENAGEKGRFVVVVVEVALDKHAEVNVGDVSFSYKLIKMFCFCFLINIQ